MFHWLINNRGSFAISKVALASVLGLMAAGILIPKLVEATIYQPGETLEPDCAPGSPDCGVSSDFVPDSRTINGHSLTNDVTLTTSDIDTAGDQNYVTDAGLVVLNNTSGTNSGDVSLGTSNGLSLSEQELSLGLASAGSTGALTALDWNTFNDKQDALGFTPLDPANNLSDLADASTARTNLGLGSAATADLGDLLQAGNNLSDLTDASVARTNLGLGSAATQSASDFLQVANNLSDLGSASTARTNLGLGALATLNSINNSNWSGTALSVANGGTGATTANDALNVFLPSQGGNSGKVLSTDGANASWVSAGGTGTVTSVGLSLPSFLTVSGSPVTASGTLSASLASQSANLIFASPDGGAGTPDFRSLAEGDLPSIPNSKLTNSSISLATGTSGSDVNVSGSPVSLGGTVTLNIPDASASNRGALTALDWTTFNNKQSALGFTPLNPANNLSDLANAATARTNLGLGTAATQSTSDFLQVANNLSDLGSASTARTNLGLGSLATLSSVNNSNWSGTALSATNGGTGITSYTTGDLLYASSSTTLAKLSDVASGSCLVSGGVGAPPSWGSCGLLGGTGTVTSVDGSGGTTGLTVTGGPITTAGVLTLGGTLNVANGGTGGTATPTAGAVAYGTGSAYAFGAAGSTGQILQSNGSSAPTWSTPTYPSASGTAGKILRSDGTNNIYSTSTFADTYTINNLLFASSANTVQGLATANNGVLVTSASGVPSISTTLPSGLLFTAGGGSGTASFGGTLNSNSTSVGNTADTNEDDLMTYSLPANTLSTNNTGVRILAWGTTAANSNSKTIRLKFGSTTLATLSSNANNKAWFIEATVLRSGATTQVSIGRSQYDADTTVSITNTSPAETLSGAVTIKATGQSGTATANNIVQRGMTIEYIGQ